MNLDEIYLKEDVSIRAINTCKVEGLYDLNAISEFYKVNGTFLGLRNCGKRTNRELIELCNKYDSKINIDSNENQFFAALSINEIKALNDFIQFEFGLLSVRSKNALRNLLEDNVEISSFLEKILLDKNFDIYSIRNVGVKSALELQNFIEKVKSLIFQSYNTEPNSVSNQILENGDLDKTVNLTLGQIRHINNFIISEFSGLSVRVQNVLNDLLDYNLDIRNFSDKIFSYQDLDFYKLRNIGSKSLIELNGFIKKIQNLLRVNEENVGRNCFGLNVIEDQNTTHSITPNYDSIFQIVNDFINQNKIFKKENEKLIFQEGFRVYSNTQEITLEKIGGKLNLTRERIRQIRDKLSAGFSHKFQFIKAVREDLSGRYNIDISGNIIELDISKFDCINHYNNTSFSGEFITFLISVYLSDEFELIGGIEDVLLPKYFKAKERFNWGNFYLVNKKISNHYNFNDFANDINKRLNERIEETYKFNFKSYVSNFSIKSNPEILNLSSEVAEYILNNEFGVHVDIDDNIVFSRNKFKQVHEYAIEALEKLGKPSKIEEIYKLIVAADCEITKSQSSLRGSLQRTPEIIYFGRSSTYGLKKWENEYENIRGGTIKDIIDEFLTNKDFPVHISDLSDYVSKFRSTTIKNIYSNLRQGKNDRFCFLKNGYIGLTNKSYDLSDFPSDKQMSRTIFNHDNMIKYHNLQLDLVIDIISKKYNYSKWAVRDVIQRKINSNFFELDSSGKFKVQNAKAKLDINEILSKITETQKEGLFDKIKAGDRLAAFFFYYNIHAKKLSRKYIDETFDALWTEFSA